MFSPLFTAFHMFGRGRHRRRCQGAESTPGRGGHDIGAVFFLNSLLPALVSTVAVRLKRIELQTLNVVDLLAVLCAHCLKSK